MKSYKIIFAWLLFARIAGLYNAEGKQLRNNEENKNESDPFWHIDLAY